MHKDLEKLVVVSQDDRSRMEALKRKYDDLQEGLKVFEDLFHG